ncbi:hypothetical protein [Streptomyces exfoliatus]|uniref:hypothetical protein n=1 Tax=Streptomyces exfoliatus TaxID=1905 RepID=UPI0037996444
MGDTLTATRHAFERRIELVCDREAWNYSLTAHSDTARDDVAEALAHARELGLEPIPDEEPSLLPDGSIRMWLHPIDPFENDPFDTEALCASSN